jgi:hypothetical protein
VVSGRTHKVFRTERFVGSRFIPNALRMTNPGFGPDRKQLGEQPGEGALSFS